MTAPASNPPPPSLHELVYTLYMGDTVSRNFAERKLRVFQESDDAWTVIFSTLATPIAQNPNSEGDLNNVNTDLANGRPRSVSCGNVTLRHNASQHVKIITNQSAESQQRSLMHFFLANTLKAKVKHDKKISVEFLQSVIPKVLDLIAVNSNSKTVCQQLCQAVPVFALRCSWGNCVDDILSYFCGSDNSKTLSQKDYVILLTIFSSLPLEFQDARVVNLPKQVRQNLIEVLSQSSNKIINLVNTLLSMIMTVNKNNNNNNNTNNNNNNNTINGDTNPNSNDSNNNNNNTVENILPVSLINNDQNIELFNTCAQCVTDWTKFFNLVTISNAFSTTNLLAFLLAGIAHEETCQKASESLIGLIKRLTTLSGEVNENERPISLLEHIQQTIAPLVNWIVAEDLETGRAVEADETIVLGSRLVTRTFRSLMKFASVENAARLFGDLSLQLTACKCPLIVGQTFEFWFDFVEQRIKDDSDYLARAVDLMVVSGTLPTTFLDLNEDARQEWWWYRRQLRDALRRIVNGMPGMDATTQYLARMTNHLQTSVNENSEMFLVETYLHAVSLVGKNISRDESVYLPVCFNIVVSLPKHPLLMRTSVILLGVYSEWIVNHTQSIESVFHLLIQTFMLPENDPLFPMREHQEHASAVAFLKLCKENPQVTSANVPLLELLNTVQELAKHVYTERRACMSLKSYDLVLKGTCVLLSCCSPEDVNNSLAVLLNQGFEYLVKALEGLITADMTNICANINTLITELMLPQTIIHPVVQCLSHYWVALTSTFQKGSTAHIGSLCKVFSNVLQFIHQGLDTIIPPIEQVILETYKNTDDFVKKCKLLKVLTTIPPLVKKFPGAIETVARAVDVIIISLITQNTESASTSEYSQFVSEVCLFFINVGNFMPAVLTNENRLNKYFEFINCNTNLQLKPGTAMVVNSIDTLFKWVKAVDLIYPDPNFNALLNTMLQNFWGPVFVRHILNAVAGQMPSWCLDQLTSSLANIWDVVGDDYFRGWLHTALFEQDFVIQKSVKSPEQKSVFIEQIMQPTVKGNTRSVKTLVKQFCGGKKKGTGGTPPRVPSPSRFT